MKNAVCRDVTPCGCCKNRRFGERSPPSKRLERISVLGTLAVINGATCQRTAFLVVFSSHVEFQAMDSVQEPSYPDILMRF
jgi:hypothetical protein